MVNCPHCGEALRPGEPAIPVNEGAVLFHKECLLRQVTGSVGHLLGMCPCWGGAFEDPPHMTTREAASAAAYLFNLLQKWGVPPRRPLR